MKKFKAFIEEYKRLIFCPEEWTVVGFIESILFWSFIIELPLYIMCGQDIIGLFLTYLISLIALTTHVYLYFRGTK